MDETMARVPVLSIDGESNGLGGEVFAVGWVLGDIGDARDRPRILSRGYLAGPCPTPHDPWVAEHVLGVLPRPTHTTVMGMRAELWDTFARIQAAHDPVVLVDVGFPVEARLWTELMRPAPERAWTFKAPVLDLASILFAIDSDPMDTSRLDRALETVEIENLPLTAHHPTDDALVAFGTLCWALRKHPGYWHKTFARKGT